MKLGSQYELCAEIVGAAPCYVGISDVNGQKLYINRSGREMIGIGENEDVSGKFIADFHPAWARSNVMDVGIPAAARDGIWKGESALLTADGREVPISQIIIAHKTPGGAVEKFSTIMCDIAQVKESEEWYRALFEEASVAITLADAGTGALLDFNREMERLSGWEKSEIIGKPQRIFYPHDPGGELNRDSGCFHAESDGNPVEAQILSKDGRLCTVEIRTTFLGMRAKRVALSFFRDITDRKRYEAELERLANHDDLTGLTNRNLLHDRLSQEIIHARRHSGIVAVLFLDLDNFTNVNESLGHDIGDKLLKGVAGRLLDCVRGEDTVARPGGDQFVVVLPEVGNEKDAGFIADKLLHSFFLPFNIAGQEIFASASMGVALYPKDGEDGTVLLRNAESAMYCAKEQGRNSFRFYMPEMNGRALEHLTLENALRRALERDEFVLHYQPQVDLKSGEIVGVEALVRWMHPENGMVAPSSFIPMAEETGLIEPLGKWVLRAACAQGKAWLDQGLDVVVAVNLSARQFRNRDFSETVMDALGDTGLNARNLELELTESILIQRTNAVNEVMRKLHETGVQLSIDDFGTGYSSLSYLKHLPIDKLKIDQSFVRDMTNNPEDAAIVSAIISLAHNLRLRVIAEGVETVEQQEFLCSRGCDEMQGYFFSEPLLADEATKLLAARKLL